MAKKIKVTKEPTVKKAEAKGAEAKEKSGRIKWVIDGAILIANQEGEVLEDFDARSIFPEFDKLNEVQRYLVGYGIKQRLADSFAGVKDPKKRKANMQKVWQDLKDGKVRTKKENLKAKAERLLAEGLITKETFDILFKN